MRAPADSRVCRTQGVTLIELLVVVVVIAVVLSIAFPVLVSSRLAGRGVATVSNLKQIGVSRHPFSGRLLPITPPTLPSAFRSTARPRMGIGSTTHTFSTWRFHRECRVKFSKCPEHHNMQSCHRRSPAIANSPFRSAFTLRASFGIRFVCNGPNYCVYSDGVILRFHRRKGHCNN